MKNPERNYYSITISVTAQQLEWLAKKKKEGLNYSTIIRNEIDKLMQKR